MTDITAQNPHNPLVVVPEAVKDWVRQQHEQQVEYDRMRALIDEYEVKFAVMSDQLSGAKSALVDQTAKAEWYMRLNAQLMQIFTSMVALCTQAAQARAHVGRPNGAAPAPAAGSDEVPRFLLQPLGEPGK